MSQVIEDLLIAMELIADEIREYFIEEIPNIRRYTSDEIAIMIEKFGNVWPLNIIIKMSTSYVYHNLYVADPTRLLKITPTPPKF